MRAVVVVIWVIAGLMGFLAVTTQPSQAAPPSGKRFFCFWWRTIRNDQTRCLPPTIQPPASASVLKTIVGNPANVRAGEEIEYRIEYSTGE